jgi:DNA-binding NarL/FixJ family response regulator
MLKQEVAALFPTETSPLAVPAAAEPRLIELLLADEQTLLREALTAWCQACGGLRVVSQVGSAEKAWVEIQRLDPTLALLDLGLSDLAATELIRRVREAQLRTRCVVLSVRKDRKTVLDVLRAGAYGYVLKSSTGEQMAEALRQVARGGLYLSPQIEMLSLFDSKSRTEADPLEALSQREFQVFSLLVEGVRAKEIAARLLLSPKTVDTHRSKLMRKLEIYDLAGLVKFAMQRDLAPLRP